MDFLGFSFLGRMINVLGYEIIDISLLFNGFLDVVHFSSVFLGEHWMLLAYFIGLLILDVFQKRTFYSWFLFHNLPRLLFRYRSIHTQVYFPAPCRITIQIQLWLIRFLVRILTSLAISYSAEGSIGFVLLAVHWSDFGRLLNFRLSLC